MADITIPNRPAGGDTRAIANLIANFDAILVGANTPGLTADQLRPATLTADKIAQSLRDMLGLNSSTDLANRKYVTGSNEVAFSGVSVTASTTTLNLPPGRPAVLLAGLVELKKTSGFPAADFIFKRGGQELEPKAADGSLGSSYSWYTSAGFVLDRPNPGIDQIYNFALRANGGSGMVRNRHFIAMVWDYD